MQLDEQTTRLLRSKGIRCICQLCDCGRPHKHPGCTKNFPSMKSTMELKPSMGQKTDYQKSFGLAPLKSPAKIMRPLPATLNPNPPVMDFRTTNRLDFKKYKNAGRTKPCKLQEEYETLTGLFQGDSVYKVDFPGHRPAPVKIERPATQKAQSDVKFDARTMYKDTFEGRGQPRLKAFQELPSFTYSILYPERGNPVEKISFKNAVHSGEFAEKPELLAPKESTVKIGMEGEHEMVTTNSDAFKTHQGFVKEQPFKVVTEWKPRPKFDCKTQAQDDFKGFGNKMPRPRKAITPPPETIDLKIDDKQYFETTKYTDHKITWDKNKLHRPPLTKVEERYSPPKEKLESQSVMRADFKKHNDVRPVALRPPDQTRATTAKFFSDTSYKAQFPNYGDVEVQRYGDPYEQPYYVKPLSRFLEEPSVMRRDFKDHGPVKRRSPILPENKRHAQGDQFHGETSYHADFLPKSVEPCTFAKLLTEKDPKEFHGKIESFMQSKPSPVKGLRTKTSHLAASF
ncbi:uncharacterized protein LOC135682057 isoform X2 [Rhopilema esculentum]|eukprot:gene14706-5803_t